MNKGSVADTTEPFHFVDLQYRRTTDLETDPVVVGPGREEFLPVCSLEHLIARGPDLFLPDVQENVCDGTSGISDAAGRGSGDRSLPQWRV